MRKAEFIDAIAKKTGLKKKDADKALNAILETITGH
jgi:nucleoid DNA-binding protein